MPTTKPQTPTNPADSAAYRLKMAVQLIWIYSQPVDVVTLDERVRAYVLSVQNLDEALRQIRKIDGYPTIKAQAAYLIEKARSVLTKGIYDVTDLAVQNFEDLAPNVHTFLSDHASPLEELRIRLSALGATYEPVPTQHFQPLPEILGDIEGCILDVLYALDTRENQGRPMGVIAKEVQQQLPPREHSNPVHQDTIRNYMTKPEMARFIAHSAVPQGRKYWLTAEGRQVAENRKTTKDGKNSA